MLNPVVALSVESQLENEEEGGSASNANQAPLYHCCLRASLALAGEQPVTDSSLKIGLDIARCLCLIKSTPRYLDK